MFTGIITAIGTVASRTETGGELTLAITCPWDAGALTIGESIACSGVCLTVVAAEKKTFTVQLSQETVNRSAAHLWDVGAKLNLERAMCVGDRLGGHIVSGHVDGLAKIISIEPSGGSHVVMLEAPKELAKYVAAKGSVTLDGISLTVNTVETQHFTVNIIPHTWNFTTLGARKAGDSVNLEIDMIARYVERLMHG
jgi:riboflavin synthase